MGHATALWSTDLHQEAWGKIILMDEIMTCFMGHNAWHMRQTMDRKSIFDSQGKPSA